jgi:hypothetical protein
MREWRKDHGEFICTNLRATGWMFGALFFSYVAEFIPLFLGRSAARPWLPLACYFPLVPVWLWRRFYV